MKSYTQEDAPLLSRRRNPWPVAAAVVAALALGMFIGRFNKNPGPDAAPSGEPSREAAPLDAKSQGEEQGIVKFDAEALKLAGLRVEPVGARPLQTLLTVTGTVEPNLGGVVKVTPRVGGKVSNVLVNVGDAVKAGQTLATLSSTELAEAQAAYRQAVAKAAAATAHLRRQRELATAGEFGQPRIQESRTAFTTAQGDVNEAQAEINATRNEVAQARAASAAANSAEESARSDVETARATAAQADTQIAVAQSRFDRQDALLKEGLTSREEWETTRADLEKAKSDARAAQAGIRSAEARVGTAQAGETQARAVIDTNSARLEQAQAKLAASRQRHQIAREALRREQTIFGKGILTSKEVAEAEAELRQAQLDVRASADKVRLLGGRPGGETTLAITAPIGGRITERAVSLGETVTSEKALFTLLNLQSVWVQLNIYPKDIPFVRAGQAMRITSDTAPGRTFDGTISYISDVVDETTRTAKARAVITNAGSALKPQTFVQGTVASGRSVEGVAVPSAAVQNLGGQTVVFVQAGGAGEFKAREVRAGKTFGGVTQIASGLRSGERVVTQGAFVVKAQAMKSELSED
jgi:cobalt-zinc-cadmium efflux system membrane fusion protein